jgi:hypothetical protein
MGRTIIGVMVAAFLALALAFLTITPYRTVAVSSSSMMEKRIPWSSEGMAHGCASGFHHHTIA